MKDMKHQMKKMQKLNITGTIKYGKKWQNRIFRWTGIGPLIISTGIMTNTNWKAYD